MKEIYIGDHETRRKLLLRGFLIGILVGHLCGFMWGLLVAL